MSTTTALHPAPGTAATGQDGPGLPTLAVDLVTEPSLRGRLAGLARGIEEAGAGAVTLSDGGLHPVHVASFLAPLTRTLGLLPRTDAVYVEPFHLATQLMSLDHLSHGRAGWLLSAETDPAAAAAAGRVVLGLGATAREAADVLEAARLVWDSWAPDAVVRDVEHGVYVDAARLQYTDVEAESFSLRGPAITPRSPQGLLPVLVADADRAAVGERVARELADGRVLDLDVSGGARPESLADSVETALTSADEPPIRLVRLVGLNLDTDPLGTLSVLTAALRERYLIAPAPRPGQDLRTRLGLPVAEHAADPLRRADRARRPDPAGRPDPARRPDRASHERTAQPDPAPSHERTAQPDHAPSGEHTSQPDPAPSHERTAQPDLAPSHEHTDHTREESV